MHASECASDVVILRVKDDAESRTAEHHTANSGEGDDAVEAILPDVNTLTMLKVHSAEGDSTPKLRRGHPQCQVYLALPHVSGGWLMSQVPVTHAAQRRFAGTGSS